MKNEKIKMKKVRLEGCVPLANNASPACLFSLFFLLFSFVSCLSVVENAGRVLDGSAFTEKTIAVYRSAKKDGAKIDMEIIEVQNKAGEHSVILSFSDYPMMKLRGLFAQTGYALDKNGEFYLTSLEYLSGSANGWNEFTMSILGEGILSLSNAAIMVMENKIEKVEIISGRIRRYDTRIISGEALAMLRNRRERIEAIVEWMNSREYEDPGGQNLKDFENYWKPVLFPEIVTNRNKPDNWLHEGDVFQRNEDIRWNTGYTERVFPEGLHNIRNSGTMLRDWEEALPWIYLEYEWDNIISMLQEIIHLEKIK